MSAVDALRMARAAGLELEVDGDDLLLAAFAPPSVLSRHKAAIVALLRPGGDGCSTENWWSFFDERADIAQRKGGLTRIQAEERAWACCVVEWLNRNFVRSATGRCFACGGGDHTHEPLLPFGIDLSYRVRIGGGEWQDVAETVRIVRVTCRYGGARPYFICPGMVNGIACGRRVAKLHGPGRYFLCHRCYRLAHASQNETVWDRDLRRANKIRLRLGGDPGMFAHFPERPKGMWRRTYERLREQVFDADMRAEESFELRAEALLIRIDNRKHTRRLWR